MSSNLNDDNDVKYPRSPMSSEVGRYWFIISLLTLVVLLALATTALSLRGASPEQLSPLSGLSASLNGIVLGMLVAQGKTTNGH